MWGFPGMTPLYGHTSQDTAYLVADYPYGFKLRCQIRYWLEYKLGKGYRFVSQTTNPKRGEAWNKPKASTYTLLAACMYLDENNRVQWDGLSEYSDAAKVAAFVEAYPATLNNPTGLNAASTLKEWASAKATSATLFAEGKMAWHINGKNAETPADLERYKLEASQWLEVAEACK